MEQCITEQAWLKYTWTFDKLLSQLPVPGTRGFATLMRDLRPYALLPGGVSVEGSGSSLSDISLQLSLEGERALVRIFYAFFDVGINYFSEGDEDRIRDVITIVSSAIREIDQDAKQSGSQITLKAHLSLSVSNPETFLGRHLIGGEADGLTPDLFYYRLGPTISTHADSMRIGVTKSLLLGKALFVELTADYNTAVDITSAGDRFAKDAKQIFAMLGLDPRSKGKG